ncbi:MAG: cytochrome C oxidase subunit IV family protein [Bdellovibrio bacteriovorus]
MTASIRSVDWTWGTLVALTLAGVALGEGAQPGFWVTLSVAAIAAVKGRLVIDQFMELGGAHPSIRRLVRLFGLLVPALMVLVDLFGPQIAQVTTLSRG